MKFLADLHLHSKYSRAVSRDMVLPIMAAWAKKKGIDILTTSDWTHPLWFREIRGQLGEAGSGVYRLKSAFRQETCSRQAIRNSKFETNSNDQNQNSKREPLFLLTVEVASIYSQGGRLRRIHNLIFSPSFETAEKINKEFQKRGVNLLSDGRPMMGLSAQDVVRVVLEVDERCLIIPSHIWTPWFSLYGSNSGFDSIEECFGDYAKYIYGIETGLSSDPEMNWRIKELDNRTILSFSDAHSPAKMGREATVFVRKNGPPAGGSNKQITYDDMVSAIRKEPSAKFTVGYTIEFYPEEGKYHYTGHRNCHVVQSPQESKDKGLVCPVCQRRLTVGVMHRVEDLTNKEIKKSSNSDEFGVKWVSDATNNHPPFVKLVPLLEIISEALSMTTASLKVKEVYDQLVQDFDSEISVLLKTEISQIEKIVGKRVAEGIKKVRKGDISISPGFDGEYGKVKIWADSFGQAVQEEEEVRNNKMTQLGLEF